MKKEEIEVAKVELVLPTHLCFKQIQRQALETSEANLSLPLLKFDNQSTREDGT